MEAMLCICNNCNTIMVDENPSNQPEFNMPDNVQDMEYISDEAGGFWACPICKTDEYLSDVTSKDQLN